MGDSNFGQFLMYLAALVINFGFSWAVVAAAATLTALHIGVRKLSERDPPIQPLGDRKVFAMRPASPKLYILGRARYSPRIVSASSSGTSAAFVTTLADHPLEKIHDIHMGGYPIMLGAEAFKGSGGNHRRGVSEHQILEENVAVEFNPKYLAAMKSSRGEAGAAAGASGQTGVSFTDPADAAQCAALDAELASTDKAWVARKRAFFTAGQARGFHTYTATQLRTLALDATKHPDVKLRDHLFELRDDHGIEIVGRHNSWLVSVAEEGFDEDSVGTTTRWPPRGLGFAKNGEHWTIVSPVRRQLHTAYHAQNVGAYPGGFEAAQGLPGEDGQDQGNLSLGIYYGVTGQSGSLQALLREIDLYSGSWRRASLRNTDGENIADASMLADGVSWMVLLLRRVTEQDINRGENPPSIWYQGLPNVTVDAERTTKQLLVPGEERVGDGGAAGGFGRKADGTPTLNGAEVSKHNAALGLYDYMKRYTHYGKPLTMVNPGAQADDVHTRIDYPSVARAVREADEYQSFKDESDAGDAGGNADGKQGKVAPLSAHGVVNLNAPPQAVMDQLAMAMNMGAVTEIAGRRYIHTGAPQTITKTIQEDDIVLDSWQYSPGGPAAERATAFRCYYLDEKFREEEVGVRRDEKDFSFGADLDLQFVNNADQAEQIARIFMERALNGHRISFELRNMEKLPDPHEEVWINLPVLGILPSERWRVTEVAAAGGGARISAFREDQWVYKWQNADKFRDVRKTVPTSHMPWSEGVQEDVPPESVLPPTGNFLRWRDGEGNEGDITWRNDSVTPSSGKIEIR